MPSFMSPPKGGSDVQDALMSTQRNPNYLMGKKEKAVKQSQVNNISGYVEHNLGKNVQKRFGERR